MSKSADNIGRGRLISIGVLLVVTGCYAGVLLGAQLCERAPVDMILRGYATKTASYGWPMVYCFRESHYLIPWGPATKANWRLTQANDEWYPQYLAVNVVVILLITASVAFATWDSIRFVLFRSSFSIGSLFVFTAAVAGVFVLDNATYMIKTMQWDPIPSMLVERSWPFRIAVWIGLFCVAYVAIVTACDLAKLAGAKLFAIAGRGEGSKMSVPNGEL